MSHQVHLHLGLSAVFDKPNGMDYFFIEMASMAIITIALFGIALCLMQTEFSRVSRSFALLLSAVVVNQIPDAFARVFDAVDSVYVQPADLIIWLSSVLCLAPLFWIYVYTLTSTDQRRPAHLYRHLLLPAFAVLLGLIIFVSPHEVWASLFAEEPDNLSGWSGALVVAAVLLQIALIPQIAFYLYLILRRMMRYRLLLRDYYASTEAHELRWIYVIGGLAGLNWLARVFLLLVAFDQTWKTPVILNSIALAGLALFATLTLWGLRQRPPLVPEAAEEQSPEPPEDQSSEKLGEKYEKSALSEEAASRISRKLRAAMEADHLHRNPNLSLWVLARHIGASPNYISQTLNEVIGESFFDFVNGYRIAEAMTLLSTTNASVLTITYDVGFNARSSFYNAFKRVSGQTPTNYRKKMSKPVGTDDLKA